MANKKFTDLPAAGTITGAEILAMVQGGDSVQGDIDLIKVYFDTLYSPIPVTASYYANTMTGYGSTATCIPYYTNQPTNSPNSQFTVSNSSTNGLSITINVAGVYSFSASFDTVSQYAGLSLNASSLTTALGSLAAEQILGFEYLSGAGFSVHVAVTRRFAVNDVIRPHTGGGAVSTAARCNFICEKVG